MDARSEKNLVRVHPDLVKVIRRAAEISPVKFIVTQGVRTMAEQVKLKKAGASRTLRSRHIPATSREGRYAHAVDVAALVGGKVRWDWPLYPQIAAAVAQAAKDVGVKGVEWGGTCFGPEFKDGPHFQLMWRLYP